MRLESKKYLFDIVAAARLLVEFSRGKKFEDYVADALLRSAVERQFEVIGEAVTQLVKSDSHVGKQIPDYRRVIAFRNLLIHGYAQIDHRIVWDVLQTNLPALLHRAEELLREED